MRAGEFEIRESEDSGQLRLTLLGELDVSVGPELRARLEELRAEGRSVLMDLSGLEFMDSTGVAIMAWAIEIQKRWLGVRDRLRPLPSGAKAVPANEPGSARVHRRQECFACVGRCVPWADRDTIFRSPWVSPERSVRACCGRLTDPSPAKSPSGPNNRCGGSTPLPRRRGGPTPPQTSRAHHHLPQRSLARKRRSHRHIPCT